jgi:hypothetical protein
VIAARWHSRAERDAVRSQTITLRARCPVCSSWQGPTGGATWQQIGHARGTSADGARQNYRQWAAGQHQPYITYEGKFGLNDAEYTAALERTGLTEAERREREATAGARRT